MPEERHEHYDTEGSPTGYTLIVRESEWDDHERDRMLALMQYEAGVCSCGFHISLTDDRTNFFTFESRECPVCKASARMARTQEADDKGRDDALGDKPHPGAPRAGDGRKTMVRLMLPHEVEALRGSVAQQSPRQHR